MAEPWERLVGRESPRAYAAFLAYRDAGPNRSLDTVRGRQAGGKRAAGRIALWSREHKWVERVQSWDAHLQRERDRVAADRAAMWEGRRLDAVEQDYAVGSALRDKAAKLLQMPLTRQRVERDGGKTIVIIEPLRLSARDAAIMARTGSDLVAQAIAAATGRPVPEPDQPACEWTPEQIERVRMALAGPVDDDD